MVDSLAGVVDSHCHLQTLEPDEAEAALDDARERGVAGFLVPAIHLGDADRLLELCDAHDDVWCALGTHPHEASRWTRESGARLEELLDHEKVVAVGECGLDFHYDNSPREAQDRALREQWELAVDRGLPVIVHNRDSNDEMLATLRRPEFGDLAADFHSFTGGLEMGREIVDRGFYVGFSGMVTFKRAENIREVLPIVPDDRLLVETDTPYLAPVPHRGKPNRPAWVVEVAERVAEEKGWPPEDAARITTGNFFRLFPKAARAPTEGAVPAGEGR